MASPYLSNFMNSQSPDTNEIRKVHLFTGQNYSIENSTDSR